MPVRDGVRMWAEAMRMASETADVSAQRWAGQYEEARPKKFANYRLDPAAYRKGLKNAGAPTVGPATQEAYRMSEQAAKEALAKATAPPATYGGGSADEAVRLHAANDAKVNCYCNILARTDEDKAYCNQILEDYIFRRIEKDQMDEALVQRFGVKQVRHADKTARKHCPV